MKKIPWIAAGVCMALPLTLFAADNPDASFYKKAAEGGIAEVQMGQLAQDKSSTQSVKDFGAMMMKDHSAANDKLKAIADGKGIKLPTSPSVTQKASKTKLDVLTGNTFDRSYIKGMIEDHQEDIKEFQREASSGQDPDAKAFAASTLPTLRAHLKKIQEIASAQGINAT